MKTKKLFLMAAMLLMSVCTNAQSETPLKGDVNEDGMVDMADVSFILNIIREKAKQNQPETEYFIYAAQTPPSAEQNPKDNVLQHTGSGRQAPGWYSLGTTIPSTIMRSFTSDDRVDWYVAVPTDGYYRDTAGDYRGAGFYEQVETLFYDGVPYTVFKTNNEGKSITVMLASLKVTDIVGR